MKIGVLILAHRAPDQLKILIDSLQNPSIKVYLHLDKKAEFGYNDIEGPFIPVFPQFLCSWGGYNVVRATFLLLKKAFQDGCDYFVLISGEDFPLYSNESLIDFFRRHQGTSFIHLVRLEDVHLDPLVDAENFIKRFTLVHVPRRNPKNFVERVWFSLLARFRNLQKKYTFFQFPVPHGMVAGENWFNLYRDDVSKLLKSYRRAWWLRLRLSAGLSMEEVLPHTLLQYLMQKSNWRNDSLRYTVWKAHTSSPEYLTTHDLDNAIRSGDLFARKFNDMDVIRDLQGRIKHTSSNN